VKGKKSVGIIETYGLTAAINAADTALKAANVELIGYEPARGSGLTTVKVVGDVGSVKAAMNAANASASKVGKVVAVHVIPRPHEDIDIMLKSEEQKPKQEEPKAKKEELEVKKQELQVKKEKPQGSDSKQKTEGKNLPEQISYTCNLCKDPRCPRKKGEPRVNCIHYGEDEN